MSLSLSVFDWTLLFGLSVAVGSGEGSVNHSPESQTVQGLPYIQESDSDKFRGHLQDAHFLIP
jgi:hypothetical protein